MKFANKKSQDMGSAITGGPLSGGITADNYEGLAGQFIKTHGGEGFVIRSQTPKDNKRPTPAQWRAWIEYFSDRRIPTVFARQHGVVTVPTEWPEDFDFTAPLSDRLWTPLAPLPPDPISRSTDVQRLMRGLITVPPDARRASRRPVIDLTAPLTVSDRLRASNEARNRLLDEVKP